MKPTLTVFTPAYNRAHTIERTYKSLCHQTSMDFKWIIVDDGSTDNTKNLVLSWLHNDNSFTIEYYQKNNGGMHSAHNEAYKHIDSELAVCIDSDDWMPDNGVETIISRWREYGEEKYAGMIGLDIFEDGYVIGTCFPKGLKACKTYELGRKYGVICDKKYVYRTEVIKKYLPYPEYEGEKYGEVNWLYQKIDKDYDMLCFNDIFCIVEYQDDGLSVNVYNQHQQSPRTRMYECNEQIIDIPYFKEKIKRAIQYVACAIWVKDSKFIAKSHNKVLIFCAIPLGIAYCLYLRNIKKRNLNLNSVKFYLWKDINN